MTEYGPLTGFVELRAVSDNGDPSNNSAYYGSSGVAQDSTKYAYLDTAYLELGMLLAGRAESIYHYSGGYNLGWDTYDAADDNVDQVRLTWAMSGFGLQLAIEDPRDRWGTSLSSSYSVPDIVGDITWAGSKWDAKLSGGYGETTAGSGFGGQIGMTFKLDQIAPGDKLLLQAAASSSENSELRRQRHGGRLRWFGVERGRVVPALLGSDPVVGRDLPVRQRVRDEHAVGQLQRLHGCRQPGVVSGHQLPGRCRSWLQQGQYRQRRDVGREDPPGARLVV